MKEKKESVQLLILIPRDIKEQYQEILDQKKIPLGERIRFLILDDLSRMLLYEEEMERLEKWKEQVRKGGLNKVE